MMQRFFLNKQNTADIWLWLVAWSTNGWLFGVLMIVWGTKFGFLGYKWLLGSQMVACTYSLRQKELPGYPFLTVVHETHQVL